MDLKLKNLSDSTDLMYSEVTGGIYREDLEGHLEQLRSTDRKKKNMIFDDIYQVDLPPHQYRQWDYAFDSVYDENDEPDYIEV